ncbi:MAG TPA: pectate lyase [Bacteroidales bacterium]|nr:pectate lyase [Bacteroidales bacterium]
MKTIQILTSLLLLIYQGTFLTAQTDSTVREAEESMLKATRFMVENVSTKGGYLWNYLPDMSRRWGEMEAYSTMIWVQHPGTVSMGHLFLDAFKVTGNEYYYAAAEKAAAAIIWGQLDCGGWNYIIDFAGDRSLKEWYNTIGKNGWRLEEFQHYYGNATFDDDVSSDAARFLLRMYLVKMDVKYKPALDKAINFIINSQYPLGGWPQRYPLRYEFAKKGLPDYTSYYTFNDDVIWENINFLIQCYITLGEERFLDPIYRGMNFYIITQQGNLQAAWGQQYNMKLEPTGARTYEPPSVMPEYTYGNSLLVMKFYEYTGDRKFISRIPDAIKWLENTRLPNDKAGNGKYTHPTFIELGTDKPLYVHRKGSNVEYGYYYYDYSDEKLLAHYGGKTKINIERLKEIYNHLNSLPPDSVTKNSPLRVESFKNTGLPPDHYNLSRYSLIEVPDIKKAIAIISSLDNQGRWLVTNQNTSNPWKGNGKIKELTDRYASTNAGDETDTSPYQDTSDQKYISTWEYIKNMNLLLNYIDSRK